MLQRRRLQLELLEDRILLNNRFVVPSGADNFTTFATLQAALTTPGLVSGDTIQINANSSPGTVVNADFTSAFTSATNLTIQSDPSTPATIPFFTISDATTIAAGKTLNLTNVGLGLITAGSLTLSGNGTIANSQIVDTSTAAIPITFAGTTDVLTNSMVVNNVAVGNAVLDLNTPAAGSSNLISGNTFISNVASNAQLAYFNGTNATVTDQVANNSFIANNVQLNFMLVVQESVTGLTIRDNSFSGQALIGIDQVGSTPQNLSILRNDIQLTGASSTGITITGGIATTSGTISTNVINTKGNGTGLAIIVNAGAVNLNVQGNEFQGNKIGVKIDAGANSITNIDLGGGNQNSLGGNNFRSFTAAATPTAAAIVLTATAGTLQAQNNIFAVSDPTTVISVTGGATVNATALSANAAFVDVLYEDFLNRPGDTVGPTDAGGWINALDTGTLTMQSVVHGILNSPERFTNLVSGLYNKLLGRDPDGPGLAGFVNALTINASGASLPGGANYQQVLVTFLTSPEFAARANGLFSTSLSTPNQTFVQALYFFLLGRNASAAEQAGWLTVLSNQGKTAVVNGFLNSTEFQDKLVTALYTDSQAPPLFLNYFSTVPDLLDRPGAPTAAEVASWANRDLLLMEQGIASSQEYFTSG
jgi:hypothetical protein